MKPSSNNTNANHKHRRSNRVRRLAQDVVITPVSELPAELLGTIYPDGEIPEGYFGIQRENVRALPKIVNQDVVDVLHAFGSEGATYSDVLERLVRTRKSVDRKQLDIDLKKLVGALVHSSFLVDGTDTPDGSADSVRPSFRQGDRWLSYRIEESIRFQVDSEIYKVTDTRTNQFRALKIAQSRFPNREMKEQITQRLNHEFDVIRRIDHPSIVRLWDRGISDGRTYGILDWIEGSPVGTYVYQSGDGLNDQELMDLAIQCGLALEVVHEAGYLHGDVHIGNFLVDKSRICLIDFGLARPIKVSKSDESRYPEGGVVMFTPPEYVRKKINKEKGLTGSIAGEVYSFGVILFTLFTKRYPYQWKSYREDYMRAVLNDPPLSFAGCERAPWPDLESLIHRAIAKRKGDRFASMTELLRALTSIQAPAPTGLQRPQTDVPAHRKGKDIREA